MKRFIWIDYAKSIGIYFVVLGHTHLYTPLSNVIYTWLMPVFFFISGYLFSFEKNTSLKTFAWKRFKSLLIPYLWINLITYLFWLFVGRKFGDDSNLDICWYSPLINTLLGNGKQMIHNIPTWFYICLYGLEMFYYIFFKHVKKRYIGLIILIIAGYLNYTFNPYVLPFSLNTALVGMIFYGFGYELKNRKYIFKSNIIYIIFSLLLIIVVAHFNGRINMYKNYYGNYPLFLVGAFSGIYLIAALSTLLSNIFKERKWITYVSKNTIIISGFHLLMFSFMKGFLVFVLHIPIAFLYEKILINVLFAAVSLVLCLPVAYIINRYVPFIIGKKKSSLRG